MAVLDHDPTLTGQRPGLTIIADKGYVSAELWSEVGATESHLVGKITTSALGSVVTVGATAR